MPWDETEIPQQRAKSQECIQQENQKSHHGELPTGLLQEPEVKALLMEVTSCISFNNKPFMYSIPSLLLIIYPPFHISVYVTGI